MEIFQVDAFTQTLFSGNPAAVVPVKQWPDDQTMQNVALENNLSETAFFLKNGADSYHIRWFTPETEVDLCGHATLAAAHVLFHHKKVKTDTLTFTSSGGNLRVLNDGDLLWLDFPSRPPENVSVPKLLPEAIGTIPFYAGFNVDLLVLVENENIVRQMKPSMNLLSNLELRGIIVTAEGDDDEIDFVSRFFAPNVGVPEDPVTGSAHTVLTPFWSRRLGKNKLKARQISARGGSLWCEQKGDRVHIGGDAVTVLTGQLHI
ncbi:MAG: PhzF family phenazine biosynthesis protein [Balneolaceae bacterium]